MRFLPRASGTRTTAGPSCSVARFPAARRLPCRRAHRPARAVIAVSADIGGGDGRGDTDRLRDVGQGRALAVRHDHPDLPRQGDDAGPRRGEEFDEVLRGAASFDGTVAL